ncbi:MAG: hypothetical protein ACREHD_08075 [Pirellulales bacterium]
MGISAAIVGLEFLAVEEVEWRGKEERGKAAAFVTQTIKIGKLAGLQGSGRACRFFIWRTTKNGDNSYEKHQW